MFANKIFTKDKKILPYILQQNTLVLRAFSSNYFRK